MREMLTVEAKPTSGQEELKKVSNSEQIVRVTPWTVLVVQFEVSTVKFILGLGDPFRVMVGYRKSVPFGKRTKSLPEIMMSREDAEHTRGG